MKERHQLAGPYINDSGYEVPDNKILVVPFDANGDGHYLDVIEPLKGKVKRDWFNEHFYYCLPLNIGNQYGFVIKSQRDFDIIWDGTVDNPNDVTISFLNDDGQNKQIIKNGFGSGIVTVQNKFSIKTPIGINIMTIQPPNMFIPGCVALTGVVECDQIKRDFTFNFKITIPNIKISIKKGDALGAFIPIPRYFVDKFDIDIVDNYFDKQIHLNELSELNMLGVERNSTDLEKAHKAGRRYYNGKNYDGTSYKDHQKRML